MERELSKKIFVISVSCTIQIKPILHLHATGDNNRTTSISIIIYKHSYPVKKELNKELYFVVLERKKISFKMKGGCCDKQEMIDVTGISISSN